jgi:cytokinin dehydrogenase
MISRRDFLKLSSQYSILIVGGQTFFGQTASAQLKQNFRGSALDLFIKELPKFDGVFLIDEATVSSFSKDFGLNVVKRPFGILRPANTQDIQRISAYCNKAKTALTVRGTGGAAYGQTQIQDGIIIDTTSLKKVSWASATTVAMDPGLIWQEVLDFTIQRKLTPPVLPDTIVTSVGGKASVGGIGETSYNLGSMADYIIGLEIVTAQGELKACSSNNNSDLFFAALGGMGQCGIIVRVIMQLMPAPDVVSTVQFTYDLGETEYFKDIDFLSKAIQQGAIGGHFVQTPQQLFQYQLDVSFWGHDNSEQWIKKISGRASPIKKWSFYDYANRNTKGWYDGVAKGGLNLARPYLSFFVPQQQAAQISQYLFSHPVSILGAAKVYMAPMQRSAFKRPLFSLPRASELMHFRIYRVVRNGNNGPDHQQMLKSNTLDLIPRILNSGGTVYLPFSPLLEQRQLFQQFGLPLYTAFKKIKTLHDPASIFNRGAGIF